MTTHKHDHSQHHNHGQKQGLHKDWRLWVGVIIMLVAMLVYVVSLDDSIIPGSDTAGEREPAAAGP